MPIVIARPEFIYGPGDEHVLGLFQAVKRGIFFYVGSGQANCHPTYIDDAVDGMVRCLINGRVGQIYHITGPQPVTFKQLGEAIATALGVRPPWLKLPRPLALLAATALEGVGKLTGITPPLSRTGVAFFSEDRRFSWQKAHTELDYTPQFDLQTGVTATVRWYHEKGWM
jgi:nucleoside-diphosphate-sugar epimerase